MANLSYEDTYKKLQEKGWDDARIKAALSDAGIQQTSAGGQTGGQVDNNSPINLISEYEDKDGNIKSYDEEKAEQGNIDFNNLVPTEEEDRNERVNNSINSSDAANISKDVTALGYVVLKAKWPELVSKVATKFGIAKDAAATWLKSPAGKGLLNGMSKAGATALMAINAGISDWQTWDQMKQGVVKDKWRATASAFVDNYLGGIPGYATKAFGKTPYWQNSTKGEMEDQKKRMETNEKVKATDKQMKEYRKEIDNAQEKYGGSAANEANNQITRMLAKSGDVSQEAQNKIRADLIDKGFKIKEVKDENGNTTYTWVKGKQTLQDYLNS